VLDPRLLEGALPRVDVRLGDPRVVARHQRQDVLPVGEVIVALSRPGRAAEVVDRDGRVPALGEAEAERLVETVEPADVREHHDTGLGRVLRRGGERPQPGSVGRLEHQRLVRDRDSVPGLDGRLGVPVVTQTRDRAASSPCGLRQSARQPPKRSTSARASAA